MTLLRKFLIKDSNNSVNPNKNVCVYHVANALGVAAKVRYLHLMDDLIRAARTIYTVRSRKSSVKGNTVGKIRRQLSALGARYYIVGVPGHVLLLDSQGNTIVDTASRKRDKRKRDSKKRK